MKTQNIIPFSFENNTVRTVAINGEIWFVSRDILNALGYSENYMTTRAINPIPEEWKGIHRMNTPGGKQDVSIISEQGLYFLLGRSDKQKAIPFQKWLAGEVLPSIRKTGSYSVEPTINVRELLAGDPKTPSVPLSAELVEAIDKKAWEMTIEAHRLSRIFLMRQVSKHEAGPDDDRWINEKDALKRIQTTTIGNALTNKFWFNIRCMRHKIDMFLFSGERFKKELDEMFKEAVRLS